MGEKSVEEQKKDKNYFYILKGNPSGIDTLCTVGFTNKS
jgi:hypothetical protein